jgi:hypothetical protein
MAMNVLVAIRHNRFSVINMVNVVPAEGILGTINTLESALKIKISNL